MSVWLIVTPALAWLAVALIAAPLIRRPPESIWRGMQPLRTKPLPYDPSNPGHRGVLRHARFTGWLLVAVTLFLTLMSILVAVGVVPAARP